MLSPKLQVWMGTVWRWQLSRQSSFFDSLGTGKQKAVANLKKDRKSGQVDGVPLGERDFEEV
jgi:hypothetical protein